MALPVVRAGGVNTNPLAKLAQAGVVAVKNKLSNDLITMASSLGGSMGDYTYDTLKTYAQMYGKRTGKRGTAALNDNRRTTVGRPLSIPTGFGSVIQSMPYQFGSAARHVNHGPGLRVMGSEVLCSVGIPTIPSENTPCFTFSGTYVPQFPLNPLATFNIGATLYYMMPRLASFSENFDLFAFRKFSLTYVPSTGTGANGNVAIGYCRDGGEAASNIPTYAGIMNLSPAVITPYYVGTTITVPLGNNGDDVFYSHLGGSLIADHRQAYQGKIFGRNGSSTVAAQAETFGTIIINYIIDLYSPCQGTNNPPPPIPPVTIEVIEDQPSRPLVSTDDNKSQE